MFRLTLKLSTQNWILRCNAHWTSVQVTLPHHDAAHSNKGSSGKTEVLSTQQGRNDHITAGTQLPVGFQ